MGRKPTKSPMISDYKEPHLTCRVALGLHPGTRITLRTDPLKIACKRLDPDPDPVPPVAAEGIADEAVGPPTCRVTAARFFFPT